MSEKEKLVAIVSPWEKLSALATKQFRIESLPAEKKAMVWRDDLQTKETLLAELQRIGIKATDLRMKTPTEWKGIE
jgi:hypothetical protein